MLTQVKAYSSLPSAPTLFLSEVGRAETDFVQIRDIEGLDPVAASIGMVPYGSSDGEDYVGSSVLSRNIVLTIHPNPDWNVWTYEALRRLLYVYFQPKQRVRLVFYSDDMNEVDIRGYVESFAANMFSKDPEYLASIICPSPYFKTIDPVVLTGNANLEIPITINYNGNIPGGILLKLESTVGTANEVTITVGKQKFNVKASPIADDDCYFQMCSFPMQKAITRYETSDVDQSKGISLLSNLNVAQGSEWPLLQPGDNTFNVETDAGTQHWTLEYFELFGGL